MLKQIDVFLVNSFLLFQSKAKESMYKDRVAPQIASLPHGKSGSTLGFE